MLNLHETPMIPGIVKLSIIILSYRLLKLTNSEKKLLNLISKESNLVSVLDLNSVKFFIFSMYTFCSPIPRRYQRRGTGYCERPCARSSDRRGHAVCEHPCERC